jgi:uncharacterized protein
LSPTRVKATALLVALQLTAAALSAQTRGVDSLFPARPVGYINDFAGLMDPSSEAALESLVLRLKAATGAEVVAVTLPSIGDREAPEVALAIGRRWGVGAKADPGDPRRNAGLVLLVVPRQNHQPGTGHVRIEVGNGLEGIVTDASTVGIQDLMQPDLAREAYDPAITKGLQALVGTIARGYGVSDSALTAYRPAPSRAPDVRGLGSFLPIALFILFLLLSGRGARGRRNRRRVYWGGGPWIGGGWGGGGGFGGGGGGFGGFGGGGGFSGGGGGGRF